MSLLIPAAGFAWTTYLMAVNRQEQQKAKEEVEGKKLYRRKKPDHGYFAPWSQRSHNLDQSYEDIVHVTPIKDIRGIPAWQVDYKDGSRATSYAHPGTFGPGGRW